jgi:hypothetical protein
MSAKSRTHFASLGKSTKRQMCMNCATDASWLPKLKIYTSETARYAKCSTCKTLGWVFLTERESLSLKDKIEEAKLRRERGESPWQTKEKK